MAVASLALPDSGLAHVDGGGTNVRATDRAWSIGVEAAAVDPMTGREQEVLTLVAEGFSNKLVAAELGICERTVKNHLTSIMTKLRAADRTHAVVTAVRLGWLVI